MMFPFDRRIGRPLAMTLAGLGCLSLAACVIMPEGGPTTPQTPASIQPAGNNPIIQALSANPTNVTKGQPITVTIKANDPKGQPLDYTWNATGGTLSTTTGQLVQWHPPTAAGTYTISVLVSNGSGGSTAGSLNLIVDATGNGTLNSAPAAQPSTAPTPTPAPSPLAGKVLFEDGFEGGLANWVLIDRGQLKWTTVVGEAHEGNAAVAMTDGDAVPAGAAGSASLNLKKYLDLSGTQLPRVRFAVRNAVQPATAVSLQAVWMPELPEPGIVEPWTAYTNVGSPFAASAAWTVKDLDLSAFKAKPGYLRLSASISGKQSEAFPGPMIDSVVIYDAAAQ